MSDSLDLTPVGNLYWCIWTPVPIDVYTCVYTCRIRVWMSVYVRVTRVRIQEYVYKCTRVYVVYVHMGCMHVTRLYSRLPVDTRVEVGTRLCRCGCTSTGVVRVRLTPGGSFVCRRVHVCVSGTSHECTCVQVSTVLILT